MLVDCLRSVVFFCCLFPLPSRAEDAMCKQDLHTVRLSEAIKEQSKLLQTTIPTRPLPGTA